MKAISATEMPSGDRWAAEFKWDGMRLLAATDGKQLELRSGQGRGMTSTFPELEDLGAAIGIPAVLDGEVVAFEGERPSFQRVQNRIHVVEPSATLVAAHPIAYFIFDILELDSKPTVDLPYLTRRKLLDNLVPASSHWHVPAYSLDGGLDLLATAIDRDFEGIMLKRADGPYRIGARSRDWLKIKIRQRQEFVVGGWLAGSGTLQNQMGSLIVGTWVDGSLVPAGRVGSGLTDAERARLGARFNSRSESPFASIPPLDRRPTWVEPELVVEVGFSEWPANGTIRHPTYLGLRVDVDPRSVVREVSPPGDSPSERER